MTAGPQMAIGTLYIINFISSCRHSTAILPILALSWRPFLSLSFIFIVSLHYTLSAHTLYIGSYIHKYFKASYTYIEFADGVLHSLVWTSSIVFHCYVGIGS